MKYITDIVKINVRKKKLWAKTISFEHLENLVHNGWKVYAYNDTEGRYKLEVKDDTVHDTKVIS